MSLFTGNWNQVGDHVMYRKLELYTMNGFTQYGIDLKDFNIKTSPYGGPLAWTTKEDLFTVSLDGQVTIYNMHGALRHSFSIDQEIRDSKVLDCQEFTSPQGTGMALVTTSFRFFTVNNIYDPRVRRLSEVPGLNVQPTCWKVMAPSPRDTNLVVTFGSSFYLLKSSDKSCAPININFSAPYTNILSIAVNFDSTKIALFADNGYLWLGYLDNGNFERHCEFNTKSKIKPDQLVWAGREAIVGLWQNVLIAIGLDTEWFSNTIDIPVVLSEEPDGVRIIGHTHDFLQSVPDVTYDIFRIGSISAGSLLLEASKEFERSSHKADEYMKMLKDRNDIELAVEQCVKAAAHEFGASEQKLLLRAAAFGKSFTPLANRDLFVEMCRTLRVLNNVRESNVAIGLTYVQLDMLSTKVLLDRLVLRRHYPVAIKIAGYLKIPEEEGRLRILGNWASNKVRETHLDDDEAASIIYDKLGLTSGITYADIANEAIQHGRKQLAIRLLDFETRASQQVRLLLLLDQHVKAFTRAIESGDTHLIYTVIYRLRDSLPSREFSMTIRNYPTAYALYQKLCKQEDPEKLRNLHYQEDDFNAEATCWVTESSAAESFRKARNDFAAQQTDNQIKLLRYQDKLKKQLRIDCIDNSVHETIKKLLIAKEHKLSEDLRKEFKVPDKRYWCLKISTLASQGELEKFSKAKRSPIGYEPFVDECLKANNRYQAQKYAPRVSDENKVNYLVKVDQYEEAAKFAIASKDFEALDFVISKANPTVGSKLMQISQNVRR